MGQRLSESPRSKTDLSNEEIDPFGLHASKGAAATAGKGKGGAGLAVLITITQGNAADHPTAQGAAGENGTSFDPFGVAAEQTATPKMRLRHCNR